ncbi:MAG: alanine--tRNA ligase, partial [Pseudomonadota bacterium]|nr:alanine--tRNA ligase [Pseudomonadota bacterium]
LQGVHDNYDIDLFQHLIAAIKQQAAAIGGRTDAEGAAYKVIADHLRSSCFLIADGVLPSNEGRGYVLRRIMRRAMRYAHQLGCKEPLMYRLVPSLIKEMADAYPELKRAEATITENLRAEEERFKQTLERGLKLLEEESTKLGKGQKLPGDAAFRLYDTYGFPLDLTQDILRARGIAVDTDGFEKCMEGQREMARAAWSGSGEKAVGKLWFELKEKLGATKFLGYEKTETEAKVIAIVKNSEPVQNANAGDEVYIVLDQTPFYGESGGQIGDTGAFASLATIVDTQKPLEDFIIHKAKLSAPVRIGDKVHAIIDTALRDKTRANHSATHLLHKALRETLGDHVTQKGSYVGPDRLRFDFSHPKAVSKEELATVERKVNEVIRRNTPVECRVMAPDEAIKAGAMALFGEKYGDQVRVLSMGEDGGKTYSTELCGGTHVRATGDIGLFKITSEGSVASGIRRIEAVTGEAVREYFEAQLSVQNAQLQKAIEENERLLAALSKDVKAGVEKLIMPASGLTQEIYETLSSRISDAIQQLLEENKKLSRELAEAKKQQALSAGGEVKPEAIGGIQFIGKIFDGLDPKELRPLAESYRQQADVVALATNVEGKASVVVASNKGNAVALVQAAVAELGGKGGGGKPDVAQGGGPQAEKLENALSIIRQKL